METVNEKSTAWLTVNSFDKDGVAEAPSTMTYRIDDVDSGTEILADTALTPATSVTIQLTPADNTLVDAARKQERHRVTVHTEFGVDDEHNEHFTYTVRNLEGIS